MATIDEIAQHFDPIFKELYLTYWTPAAFVSDNEGCCEECDWETTPIEDIVRVEYWIEKGNQYFFATVEGSFEIGEYPGCGESFDEVKDLLKYVDTSDPKQLHPALRALL